VKQSVPLTPVEMKTWALFVSVTFSDPVKLPAIVRCALFSARIVPVPLMLLPFLDLAHGTNDLG
jgi:hypothetical protein